MSLTARLTISMSVLVTERRPAAFLSLDVFQMNAITNKLLATEMQTQIDNNAMNSWSNTDKDDAISRLIITNDHTPAENAGGDVVFVCTVPNGSLAIN